MAAGMAGELGPMPLSVRQRARRSRSLARRWRWRLAHSFERLRVPFLRDGIDSVSSRCICALVTMSRVRKCIRSTRSKRAHRARVPKRRAAVRCHALNDLSRVVTLPGVQQARKIYGPSSHAVDARRAHRGLESPLKALPVDVSTGVTHLDANCMRRRPTRVPTVDARGQ